MDIRSKVLWWAAKRRLETDKPFTIAITGSIAKTSTKEAIGSVLKAAYGEQAVRVGYGNLNTYLGLPLAILGFKLDFYAKRVTWQWLFLLLSAVIKGLFNPLPKYLVLEMGADKPGDIQQLTSHVKPNIGILTMIGEAHLMNYRSQQQLALEKARLLAETKPEGAVIINRNDKYIELHRQAAKNKQRILEFDCPTAQIAHRVAELVGEYLQISPEIISLGLSNDWKPEGRMRITDGKYKVIDDAYNASPSSMKAALEKLSEMPSPRVAILGSMLELGKDEVDYHKEVGSLAHKLADRVIGIGELARLYNPDKWYASSSEAAQQIFDLLPEGASILVKGSHGIRMDVISKALLNKNSNDNKSDSN